MSKLFSTLVDKVAMFNVLKHAIDVFVWDKVPPATQAMLRSHIDRMEAYGGSYEVKCEVAQGAEGDSMKLTITVERAKS